MSYVHITRTPGADLADFRRIADELGPEPIAGQVSSHVGVVDGALVVVDVWATRADADRFVAERLYPAFERAAFGLRDDTDVIAFEPVADGVPA